MSNYFDHLLLLIHNKNIELCAICSVRSPSHITVTMVTEKVNVIVYVSLADTKYRFSARGAESFVETHTLEIKSL